MNQLIKIDQLNELKKNLPRPWLKPLSEKSGVCKATVSKFFNGGNVKSETIIKILTAAKELRKESSEEIKNLIES